MQINLASFKHIIFPGTGCRVPYSRMVFNGVNSNELKKSGIWPLFQFSSNNGSYNLSYHEQALMCAHIRVGLEAIVEPCNIINL